MSKLKKVFVFVYDDDEDAEISHETTDVLIERINAFESGLKQLRETAKYEAAAIAAKSAADIMSKVNLGNPN